MRTDPLHYAHGGELIVFHNTIWDGFTSIVKDMRFHVSHEQTYVLPLPSFQTFHWQIDIVLSIDMPQIVPLPFLIDGTHTFVDVVIATPTRINLVFYVVSSHVVVMTMVTQAKEKLYHDWHSIRCISSPYNGGFWLPTSTNGWFSSLMC
jgi:hypothetical protein